MTMKKASRAKTLLIEPMDRAKAASAHTHTENGQKKIMVKKSLVERRSVGTGMGGGGSLMRRGFMDLMRERVRSGRRTRKVRSADASGSMSASSDAITTAPRKARLLVKAPTRPGR